MEKLDSSRGYTPDVAVPPGTLLKETIDSLGMSQKELAQRMGRPHTKINELIHGKIAITPQTATQLECVLGAPAKFWMRLEMDYQMTRAKLEMQEQLANEAPLLDAFPYLEMSKLGWIAKTRKREEKVINLLSFFGVTSLRNLSLVEEAAFRKSAKRQASPEALSAWLRKGELEAHEVEVAEYDAQKFKTALQSIRSLTLKPIPEATNEMKCLCAESGVVLLFIPHLPKTYANGATRWIRNKAVVQLSIRNRWEDVFWFTFFHECGHIMKHSRKKEFIDLEGNSKTAEEKEADTFAAEMLLPEKPYSEFCRNKKFSRVRVSQFAKAQDISPAIVVGRLQHDGLLPADYLNAFRRRLKWAG